VVERLRNAVESTGTRGWAFAVFTHSTSRTVLAASMDSIGTKPIALDRAARSAIAARYGSALHQRRDHDRQGHVRSTTVASAQVDLGQVAQLVEGHAEVCRRAECALVGAETAELPDPNVYREDELTLRLLRGDRRAHGADRGTRSKPAMPSSGFPSAGVVHAKRLHAARRVRGRAAIRRP